MRRLLARVALGLGLVVGAAVVLLVFGVVEEYRSQTTSMAPAIEAGDRVAAIRFGGPVDPERGDIVAYRIPRRAAVLCGNAGGVSIHRIVGLPGEAVVLRRGRVFVDGARLRESYVDAGRRGDVSGSWRVPRGAYFVLGDNRTESCDSRVWGSVPRERLIGEVFATYWPRGRVSFR